MICTGIESYNNIHAKCNWDMNCYILLSLHVHASMCDSRNNMHAPRMHMHPPVIPAAGLESVVSRALFRLNLGAF